MKIITINDFKNNLTNNVIENNSNTESIYEIKNFKLEDLTKIRMKFDCNSINGYSYITINDLIDLPENSEAVFEVIPIQEFVIKLIMGPNSKIEFNSINIESINDYDLKFSEKKNALVIIPNYPTNFCNVNSLVHNLNKEYINQGIMLQVACIDSRNWYELKYKLDNIEIIKGNYSTLKNLLLPEDYKLLIAYSVNEELLQIFEGYTTPEQQLLLKIKSTELLDCFNVSNYRTCYFLGKSYTDSVMACEKNEIIKSFGKKDNVTWVFESKQLLDFYNKFYEFKNAEVIKSFISLKSSSISTTKSNIAIIKNFDNIAENKVDECIETILELSHRNVFRYLNFDIYGTGDYFDELVEPINNFKNVHFHRDKWLDIPKILGKANILLNPCTYDMSSSELDYILSNNCNIVTSIPKIQYTNNENIFTLENFVGMANSIETIFNDDIVVNTEPNPQNCPINIREIDLVKTLIAKPYKRINYLKPDNPILTIVIPAYNVEKYLKKCLSSLIYQNNINELEILVINDGSKDNTRTIALDFQKKTNGIVQLIDKENGGHGSAVNLGMKLAKGKYFKILDSDDWLNSADLSILIDKMKTSNSDLILTKVYKEYVPAGKLQLIVDYPKLCENIIYKFDDLLYSNTYGLDTNPLFASCNYKTEKLRKSNFQITEKKLYADHEFDAFSLKCIDTIEYCPLNIYMYLIGREGQSVSKSVWEKKYKDHQNALFTMLTKLDNDSDFKKCRKNYIYKVNVTAMVLHQLNTMLDLNKVNEIKKFIKKLSNYPEAYEVVKSNLLTFELCPTVKDIILNKRKSKIKRVIKELLPYFIIDDLKKKGIVL